MDIRGGSTLRTSSDAFLATPRPGPGVPLPADLDIDDLLVLDGHATRVEGRHRPPVGVPLDLELLRRRPEINVVIHAQPEVALAFAAANRDLAPVTHTESELVLPPLPVVGDGLLGDTPARAGAFADAIGSRPVALLRGLGSVAVGATPAEAGMRTQQVEILARVNEIAATLAHDPRRRRTVRVEDSARVSAQKAPASDFQGYFDTVAEPRTEPPPARATDDETEAALRERIVAACRVLFAHGLVEHLEHVSVRLRHEDAFLITPRAHLGRLAAGDVAVVGMDGTWRRGPLAPPPFLWLHRDILAARPEVQAIVHTHQTVARGLVMAGILPQPIDRAGAGWLARPAAVYPIPDLMFDPVHRSGALSVLGDARVLHEAAHGSDYLAATVEEATVGAVLYERQARIWHLASRLGSPESLPRAVLAGLDAEEPAPLDWWRFLLSRVSGKP
jgi:ribulose-5-phosphate 4-epimerase/fuculose-1-phosphate aldolase